LPFFEYEEADRPCRVKTGWTISGKQLSGRNGKKESDEPDLYKHEGYFAKSSAVI
jgi:hypothetical protein